MKLEKGMPAPDIELADQRGNTWRLSDLRGQKVVLYFYPADDTPGCTAEACDFRDSLQHFRAAGYTVLAVSPQGAASHQSFASKFELNFPLLIDEGLVAAERYGAKIEQPLEWKGIPIHINRSTFVIDEDGTLAEVQYGVDARGHVGQLRETLGV